MRARFLVTVAVTALTFAACGDSGTATSIAPGTGTQSTVGATLSAPGDATPSNPLISAGFIGDIGAGISEAELRAQLGSAYEVVTAGTILADTVGFTILKGGVVQFHALHRVGVGPELDLLVTDNPDYRSAEGIGPGSTIDEAVLVYGAATVSISALGESRELVVFDRGPDGSIVFRAFGPSLGELAGVYPEPIDAFAEATTYRPGSTIGQIWVFEVEEPAGGIDTFDVAVGIYSVAVSEGSSLNIRSGPGTQFPPVGAFPSGTDDVRTTGYGALDSDGTEWWEVDLPNSAGTGWVARSFLTSG